MTPPLPGFGEFFRAVHGRAPLRWQTRLAECVAGDRGWPGGVSVLDGVGGFGCLDVAVWWLASEAGRSASERAAPTRIWWVDARFGLAGPAEERALRRVVGQDALPPKDEVVAWARELACALGDAGLETGNRAGPIDAVARRLRSLCGDAEGAPLEVVELGACPMPSDPWRPALVFCSLPMYGSRLLFRGAGAAFDAAMAGMDSLVLVEDMAVAERLAGLVGSVGDCFPDAIPLLPGARQAATVVGVAGEASADAASDGVRMPEVLPGLVWEWVKTTTPPEGEAPVEPYFSGIGGFGGERILPFHAPQGASVPLAEGCLRPGRRLGNAAAVRARRMAQSLGLPAPLCETVAFAAQHKDIGMADARIASGWPNGGRQEALSARLVDAWLDKRPDWGEPVERDLLVHLVASHRGSARPLVVPVRDGTAGTVCARIAGVDVEVSADLAQTDWEQPARFRRLNSHFGPWGLALLEAIVARSDEVTDTGGDAPAP